MEVIPLVVPLLELPLKLFIEATERQSHGDHENQERAKA
jgi:hypothetical protein